jgi:hypothetical protein
VSFDPATGATTIEAEDLPGLEHPQLQSVNPVLVSGDRLHGIRIRTDVVNQTMHFVPEALNGSKLLVWRFRDRWLTGELAQLPCTMFPLNLRQLAPAEWMIQAEKGRIKAACLLSRLPVHLLRYEETEKGRLVAFLMEAPESGAVVTNFYRIGMFGGPNESIRWEGRNVLDVSHEPIGRAPGGQGNATMHRAEHGQFTPFTINTTGTMPSGETVNVRYGGTMGPAATRNTLGGLLGTDTSLDCDLIGYVGLDDGGLRILFGPGVNQLGPTTDKRHKELPPDSLVDPIGAGRAWVELTSPNWIPSPLGGYRVGLRAMTSLGSRIQWQLDPLPAAAAIATGDESLFNANPFDLDRPTADDLQAFAASTATPSDPVRNGEGAFPVSFQFDPGVAQQGTESFFTGTAQGVTVASFAWTFAPPVNFPLPVQPVTLPGATVAFTFPFDGAWTISLTATATDGSSNTVVDQIDVAPDLWRQSWQPHRRLSTDTVDIGSAEMSLSRYRVEYQLDAQATRSLIRINYLDTHQMRLRFLSGEGAFQGRVAAQMPVTIVSTDARFKGILASVLRLNSIQLRLFYERDFSPGVGTSDRRALDAVGGSTNLETLTINGSPSPNAIVVRPITEGEVRLDPDPTSVALDVDLSDLSGGLAAIFAVILVLGLAGPMVGPIIAGIAIASGPFAPIVILAGLAFLALVAIAIGLGLSALLRPLARAALSSYARQRAIEELSRPAILADIRDGLDGGGLMTYVGEALSESIAILAIRQAIRDGHVVAPVAEDENPPRDSTGRERFRPQVFETVVVGDGRCRVLMRVS